MARRLASSGTNSTPPVIIQLRCLLHFGGILPSLISFDATFSTAVAASFSLFACGPDFVEKYFALQSQKQFAQHCDGNLIAFDCLSTFLLLFDLNGDSSNSSAASAHRCVLFRSMVWRSVWSVHPWPIKNKIDKNEREISRDACYHRFHERLLHGSRFPPWSVVAVWMQSLIVSIHDRATFGHQFDGRTPFRQPMCHLIDVLSTVLRIFETF